MGFSQLNWKLTLDADLVRSTQICPDLLSPATSFCVRSSSNTILIHAHNRTTLHPAIAVAPPSSVSSRASRINDDGTRRFVLPSTSSFITPLHVARMLNHGGARLKCMETYAAEKEGSRIETEAEMMSDVEVADGASQRWGQGEAQNGWIRGPSDHGVLCD